MKHVFELGIFTGLGLSLAVRGYAKGSILLVVGGILGVLYAIGCYADIEDSQNGEETHD